MRLDITTRLGLPILNILKQNTPSHKLYVLSFSSVSISTISSHETAPDSDHHGAPGWNFCSSIPIVVPEHASNSSYFTQNQMVFSSYYSRSLLWQRRAKIRIWNLNTYGIFNDIFQSKINVLHLSKFLRSISWEPRVMIGWASQMDARETLCCHMFKQSENMFSYG